MKTNIEKIKKWVEKRNFYEFSKNEIKFYLKVVTNLIMYSDTRLMAAGLMQNVFLPQKLK